MLVEVQAMRRIFDEQGRPQSTWAGITVLFAVQAIPGGLSFSLHSFEFYPPTVDHPAKGVIADKVRE